MKIFVGFILFLAIQTTYAQDTADEDLPYHTIPDYPETYNACTVAARMIDGLGFRYYWATDGLRTEDLTFKPSNEARTSGETLDHIYGLTLVIVNAIKKIPNTGGEKEQLTFEQKRKHTLLLLKEASDLLKTSDPEAMTDYNMVFKGKDSQTEFPFRNVINGPIADVLWHVGQVVSFWRSSGNPINPKVNVLTGNLME